MNKILITTNNIPYDNTYKNVFHFGSEEERDIYINTEIHPNFIADLNNQKEVNFIPTTSLNAIVELGFNNPDMLEKNYAIVLKGNKRIFYFINSFTIDSKNERIYRLDLEYDIFMNRFNLMNEITNFFLSKGHSNPINYLAYEQDGGDKRIVSLDKLKRVSTNEVYQQMNEKTWLYVLEKISGGETGILKNGKGGNLQEPFKVYVAPLTPLILAGTGTGNLWEGDTTKRISTVLDDEFTLGYGIPKIYFTYSSGGISENSFIFSSIPTEGINLIYDTRYSRNNIDFDNIQYKISQELLPQNIGDEVMILLPVDERNQTDADYINNILKNGGIFNDQLKLSEANDDIGAPTFHLRFIPQIIKKDNTDTYSFRNALKKEEIAVRLPKSYWLRNSLKLYYADYVVSGLTGYGVAIYEYDTLSDDNGILLNIKKINGKGTEVWNANSLFGKISDTTLNTNVISAFISNFNPVETTQETGEVNRVLFTNIDVDGKITSITYNTVLKNNIYREVIEKPFIPDFISGISKYSIVLENQKEFEIDYSFINYDEINDEYYYEFAHYASLTPEWEERLKKNSDTFIDITNDDNAWNNEKSFVKGTDAFAEYKAQNPVSSKMDYLKPFTNPFAFLSPTTLAINALGSTGSTFVQHQNLKHKPLEFSGSGDALGDLIFNEFGNSFLLAKWQYLGVERDSIIEHLKREGISYNNSYLVKSYDDIKRPVWNYIQSLEISNDKINFNTSKEIKDKIAAVIAEGITLWNDYTKYLDFEQDNGDGV